VAPADLPGGFKFLREGKGEGRRGRKRRGIKGRMGLDPRKNFLALPLQIT